MIQSAQWCVIVPVNALPRAKTRLHTLGTMRPAFARSFAGDVLQALHASTGVAHILVVGDGSLLSGTVAVEWVDSGDADLNTAIVAAESRARQLGFARIAVIVADVPCLRPNDVEVVLTGARTRTRAFVSDHRGEGTTVLTTTGPALAPAFGPGSAARHRASGAVELEADIRIRLDVDLPDDIALALTYGVGSATTAALAAEERRTEQG